MSLRAARRAVTLASALLYSLFHFWFLCLRGRDSLERRAQWQHEAAVRVMRAFGIRLRVTGRLDMETLDSLNLLPARHEIPRPPVPEDVPGGVYRGIWVH